MNGLQRSLGAIVVSAALVALVPGAAGAQSSAERQCRASISKAMNKYVGSVFKAIGKCHKARNTGKKPLSVDCNDVAQADSGGKLAHGRALLITAVASPASACQQAPGLLAQWGRCPSPAQAIDDGEATDGIDSYDELGQCLAALVDGVGGGAAKEAIGLPETRPAPLVGACQSAIAKNVTKLIRSYGKERARCQGMRDAASSGLGYGCSNNDETGRIAKARIKALGGIQKSCDLADPEALTPGNERLDAIKSCGDTLVQLQDCVVDVVADRIGSGLIAAAYELPNHCRADRVIRTVYAGYASRLTSTVLSAGSNGLAHGIDFNDGFSDILAIDCDDDCANCTLKIDPSKDTPHSFCRCASDPTISCDTINGNDLDDCGGLNNACQCHFGPPLGAFAAGNPACIPIRMTKDYTGTVDLGTGEWHNPISVVAGVHLGLDAAHPCPACTGDITPNDGVRDGACEGGARDGQPCDLNGTHPTWGGVSIDCQPQSLTNISGGGLLLNFELFSHDDEMPFALPCDSPGGMCPCRVCAGDTTIGCRNDAECPGATGPCTGGGGAGVQPNACSDRICDADNTCHGGPVDKYCDGKTHPNGDGLTSCSNDLDCSIGGNGTCSIVQPRRCYADPIVAHGSPAPFGAEVGGLACIGLTTSAVINVASGLPGAVNVGLDFDATPTCVGNPDVVWQPPGGANCVTTDTTTTTTLIGLPCVASLPPTCGGTCPAGSECMSNGVTCECQGSSTTTLPNLGCTDQPFPLCAVGTCPAGSTCQLDLMGQTCNCTAGTACGDTFFPICGGTCPLGQACQGNLMGLACACG